MLRSFLCIAAIAVFAVPSQAAILGSVLSMDGTPDAVSSDVRGWYVDNGATGFDAGDQIFGWLQVTSVVPAPPGPGAITPPSLVGIYSLTLTAPGTNNSSGAAFGVTATTGAYSLANLAPSLVGASGATATEIGNSLFVLGGIPGVFNASLLSGGAGIAGAISELTTIDGAMGFEALFGLDGADDFMDVTPVAGTSIVLEQGGFTMFASSLGTGAALLPLIGATGGTHDILQDFGTITNSFDSPWTFQGTNQFSINAVPEPGSLAIFGAILAGGVAQRRRKSKKA